MVIQASRVAMGSTRMYMQSRKVGSSFSDWGNTYNATLPTAKESGTFTANGSYCEVELYQNYSSNGRLLLSGDDNLQNEGEIKAYTDASERKQPLPEQKITEEAAKQVIQRVLGSRRIFTITLRELLEILLGQRKEMLKEMLHLGMEETTYSSVVTTYSKMQVTHTYTEQEQTAFASMGKVATADGREIDFNLEVAMSRSFMESSSEEYMVRTVSLTDPLVINLDCDTVQVTDQKFSFDLDADGELDNISVLSQMCGYLALDKNGDGRINDGSELFGTRNGDGFGELAIYDTDGNGWIDSNDEIFDKLRIWSKDSQGRDILVGLGVRGIGAIYLGNMATQFSVKDKNNETQAVVRQSGVYLKEDGGVGTIQQVDMAS